jgi:uncharacterized protein (TIGR02246 family)
MENTSSNANMDEIRQVALRWTTAVEAGNVEQLGRLMSDDIIVIHGNGRTVSGREAVMADFAHSFESFCLKQSVESEETVIAGDWAFDRARVHTTISPLKGGDTKEIDSRTLTILRKEGPRGWCVARSIGVIDQRQ